MIWQDFVLMIANLLFTYSIFSQVYYGFKWKRGLVILRTSFLTSLGLYAAGVVFFSLGLFFSGIVATTNASLWFTIFIQRIIFPKY